MSWSSRQLPARPYAYVPEEGTGGNRPWVRAFGLALLTLQGLLEIARYIFHEPEKLWVALDPVTNEVRLNVTREPTTGKLLELEIRLLIGSLVLIMAAGVYYFSKERPAQPMTIRQRVTNVVIGISVMAVIALAGFYLVENVEPSRSLIDLVDRLNDVTVIVFVAMVTPLPYVAFRRNAATVWRWWKTSPPYRSGLG